MRKGIFYKSLLFSQHHPKIIISVVIVITIIAALFMTIITPVKVNPDIDSLIPENEKYSQLIEKYSGDTAQYDYILMAFESENPFQLEKLHKLEQLIQNIEAMEFVHPSINPFNLVTFFSDGKKVSPKVLTPTGGAPRDQQELDDFKKLITTDMLAQNLVISNDATVLCAYFPTDKIKDYDSFMVELRTYIADIEKDNTFKTYVSGTIPFLEATKKYLTTNLSRLLLLSAIIILLIYYFGFKDKRAVFLPFIVVVIGTIWTLGFMAIFRIPISIVSILTPPLVLTLGSSYSIHILNQYYRQKQNVNGKYDELWLVKAISNINRTILLASLTTVAGFISLVATKMIQTKEFGIATSFGILSCAFLSLFFFPAILSLLKKPDNARRKDIRKGLFSKVLHRIGLAILKVKYFIIAFLICLIVIVVIVYPKIRYETNFVKFFPKKDPVLQDMYFITEKVGGFDEINITLTAPDFEKNYFLKPEVLSFVNKFEEQLKENKDICYITSFTEYLKYGNLQRYGTYSMPDKKIFILYFKKMFITLKKLSSNQNALTRIANNDFSVITISLRVYDFDKKTMPILPNFQKLLTEIDEKQYVLSEDVTVEVWGSSLRFLTVGEMMNGDQKTSIVVSIIAILLITIVAFKSLYYGLAALIPLATGVMTNYIFMVLFKIPFDMTTIMVSSVAIGVGVDNSIHFLIQFKKQLKKHRRSLRLVIGKTLEITGRPIALTTMSMVAGLMILCLASFKPIAYFGFLVAMALFTTAVGCLFILPSVLAITKKYSPVALEHDAFEAFKKRKAGGKENHK